MIYRIYLYKISSNLLKSSSLWKRSENEILNAMNFLENDSDFATLSIIILNFHLNICLRVLNDLQFIYFAEF